MFIVHPFIYIAFISRIIVEENEPTYAHNDLSFHSYHHLQGATFHDF